MLQIKNHGISEHAIRGSVFVALGGALTEHDPEEPCYILSAEADTRSMKPE